MDNILGKIAAQERLSQEEAKRLILDITERKYSDPQIAGILAGLQMRGVSVDELLGMREGLLETGLPVDLSPFRAMDVVGTGGDGKNTFNISTAACLVIAGAGYPVAKHGNYAASSVSGASDVIEAHGVTFSADSERHRRNLETCGFTYLHAPLFALGMKYVAPARKALGQLGMATCFNLLGPLVNPSRPGFQLLGTANLDQQRLYRHVYRRLGIQYGIVTSVDGYDEISLTSEFKVVTNAEERIYTPAGLGLPACRPEDLYGGSSKEEAMRIFDSVLDGTASEARKNTVIANAAFGIRVMEPAKSAEECAAIARESLESGKALRVLRVFTEMNH